MSSATTIIILGKGRSASVLPAWMELYPRAELWTLNGERHPRATRHFEMHWPRHHLTLDLTCPCMVHWDSEILHECEVKFPLDRIASRFPAARHFINNTIGYMLALAALERPGRVLLPGVDFTGGPLEFTDQRRCTEFWTGVLMGQGSEVIVPPGSALLSGELYS